MGFWKKVVERCRKEKRPILCLASMANVTDAAFRKMFAKYGKPDVMWTEFVSCDGLCHFEGKTLRQGLRLSSAECPQGKQKLMQDLIFDKSERPIVAQFFGAKPENFYKCAKLAQKLGFDGIDINMGCPDKGVVRQGAGSALIKNPELAQEIIKETIRGAGKLPVSVKTRIGFLEVEYKNWIPKLLEMDLAAITVHGRTKKEMSNVPAHWDIIADIVKMRDKVKSKTLIIGNGDVSSLADAKEKYKKYKTDGIMIGRAIFGTPWFFSGDGKKKKKFEKPKEKLKLALEHTKLFEKIFGKKKHFDVMKKHYKAYISGFDEAKKMRIELMKTKSLKEAKKILGELIKQL